MRRAAGDSTLPRHAVRPGGTHPRVGLRAPASAYHPPMHAPHDAITQEFQEAARLATIFAADPSNAQRVARVAASIARRASNGGKVLAVGNGGSCADAVHFCEELTGRYRKDRPPIAAVACSDAGHITCTGNDYGFDQIFARWVTALARPEDTLIALSTSGNSTNVVHAVQAARNRGAAVVLLLGKGGGRLAPLGDETWIVPGETADRIQELHMLILHSLVGAIEHALGHA